MAERFGYGAVKHQRFVGTGYFDAVATVISAGQSSTCALSGYTETEQFESRRPNGHSNGHARNGGSHYYHNGNGKPNGHARDPEYIPEIAPSLMPAFDEEEVALMPSGD
jgi:hypothetical protein